MIKIKAIHLIALISFMLLWVSTSGQNFVSDLKQINAVYENIQEIDLAVEYLLFPNSMSEKALNRERVELKQKGSFQLTRNGEIESLNNGQYLIMIDHDEKTMSVQASIEVNTPFASYPIPVDSMLSLYDSVQYEILESNLSKYSIYISEFTYEKIELLFYPKSHLIQKIVLYSAEQESLESSIPEGKPRYEIQYTKTQLNPQFPSGTFSSDKFISIKAGKIYCANSYKHYNLINYLQ